MHLAKGVEFGTVVVMACDDEMIPRQERIEVIIDASWSISVVPTAQGE